MAGDHVCSGLFPGQFMVPDNLPTKGPGQNVKGTWSICHKVPVLQHYGPGYFCSGLFPGQLMVPG